MGFSRQEHWRGLPFPSSGDLPGDWTQVSCTAGRFFTNWAVFIPSCQGWQDMYSGMFPVGKGMESGMCVPSPSPEGAELSILFTKSQLHLVTECCLGVTITGSYWIVSIKSPVNTIIFISSDFKISRSSKHHRSEVVYLPECIVIYIIDMGFPGDSDDKESACNIGDLGLIPGLGRSPGEGKVYPLQYAWAQEEKGVMVGWHHDSMDMSFEQAPGDEGQGSLACCSPWVTESQTQLTNWATIGVHLIISGNQILHEVLDQWRSIRYILIHEKLSVFRGGRHVHM